jgi:ribonucleoside-triphosphate reductase
VIDNPTDPESVLITFPVSWDDVPFDKFMKNGVELEVNQESAVSQLDRYKLIMENWCQQNVSATISYSVQEVPEIIDWLMDNWNTYVGVSFLFRADPTKTAKDLGYLYLPQEVVTKQVFDEYVSRLAPLELEKANSFEEIQGEDCSTGACPIR